MARACAFTILTSVTCGDEFFLRRLRLFDLRFRKNRSKKNMFQDHDRDMLLTSVGYSRSTQPCSNTFGKMIQDLHRANRGSLCSEVMEYVKHIAI